MKANLYIDSESISYNGEEKSVVEVGLGKFINNCNEFKEKGDDVYYFQDIFGTCIFDSFKMIDLYNSIDFFDKDTKNRLLNFIDRIKIVEDPQIRFSDIIQDIHENNSKPFAIIAYKTKTYDVETFRIIQNDTDWFNFHREFLSRFNEDAVSFVNECSIYFPTLYFHEGVKKSIKPLLDNCKREIVKCLSALNDKLPAVKKEMNKENRREILLKFSSVSGFKTTLEGNSTRKKDFTFNFSNENNVSEEVCCEPHMKIFKDDHESFSQNRRIYFHEGKPTIQNGKILIGWIGEHL